MKNFPVGQAVTRSSLTRKVKGLSFWAGKLDNTVLSTACYRCDISFKEAELPASAMMRKWAPTTRYTLSSKSASKMKVLMRVLLALFYS